MSQVSSSTSTVASTPPTNFETIFTAALKEYKKQTKRDIASHPLAAQLQSCDSPSAILVVLRARVQKFDQSQSSDEKWVKWVDPTVNVLFAFSATLGNSVGLIFPPANAIFTGIGILLQAVKDVRASQNALVDLFGRLEYFFKRLEKYIEVRPTAAMKDIIVKIMAEVLSILGIVTKELGQGRTVTYLKKLVGRKDVEDALQRLDQLTQEECRMAAAEALTIARGIDNKVQAVSDEVTGVGDNVKKLDEKVREVDKKVEGVDERVQDVDIKVEGIGNHVQTIDGKVQSVDYKVGSVVQGVKEAGVALQQVANQVTDLNRNELRKDLRKWITPSDPSINYNAAYGAHQKGTAAWCTEGKTLADWKTFGSLLWIHGKPGSGKSILSSVIIRDLKSICHTKLAFLAYFYFDFKDKTKQDSRALLSSLLIQLSDQLDIFCDALFSLYSSHKRGSEQPTDDSLAECLKDMFSIIGQAPIYLIIDALDECPNDSGIPSSRERVLKLVNELLELRHPNLHLCITSRPEFDIRIMLESLATQQISLHDESGQRQDINHYVTFVVNSDRRMKRWRDDDKSAVIETLAQKADGMFRWVFCQLEVLRHCFPTNLRHLLEDLPKSLDETYKRILKEINNANREHAYKLLQCLTVATRPLRVEELAEVLAVDINTGGIPKLNADWRWDSEDQEEAVLSACSSLVSVVIVKGSRVVQFSHFSVKEFLASDRLASCMEEVSRFHIPIEPSHVVLAQACLGVLLRLDDRTNKDTVEKIPLFRYAADCWFLHAQIGNVEVQIKDAMDRFFDMDKPHFSAWARNERPYDILWLPSQSGQPVPLVAPLYVAAACGLRGLVGRLTVKHPQHINSLGGPCGAPLHASVLGGHIEVAQFLFAHGADINSRSEDNRSPLHIASQVGHLEVGKWLLDHGADVNSREMYGRTPLHFSVNHEHVKISQILLECNAEVDSWDENGQTPILAAWERGNISILRVLLDHNADAHVRNDRGETLLHFASHRGHLELARMLLERNVEVNVQDNNGLTPFQEASKCGNLDVLQLLLDHNADEHVRNNRGSTALHQAAAYDHLEVVRFLLRRGADVNAWNHFGFILYYAPDVSWELLDQEHAHNKGMTPLHYAAHYGYLEVTRLLLEHNAEVNARDHNGLTPFLFASARCHSKVWKLLLDHHAEVHVCDKKGRTPLHFAAHHDDLELAQILLEHNVEVNARDDEGLTPLLTAWEGGNLDLLRLLLDHNVDVHVRNNMGETLLHFASHRGHLDLARILLERNVEVDAQDNDGLTPFHRASECGNLDILRVLLDHDASLHIRNNDGNTPLHHAVIHGRLAVVRLLLGHGAEVNARNHLGCILSSASDCSWVFVDEHVHNNRGMTPLHYAAHYGRLEVAQLLLEYHAEVNAQDHNGLTPFLLSLARHFEVWKLLLDHNADVHACDNNGRTPLHFAAHHGDLELAQILLERNAEVDSLDDKGRTPLLTAWERGNLDLLRLLLDHNADVHVRNDKGETLLHCASRHGYLELARIVLERSAEVNAQDNYGLTPFQDASRYGNLDVLRLLLDYNADEHARNKRGSTSLHHAAAFNHLKVVRLLLVRGADVNAWNHFGFIHSYASDVSWVLLDQNVDENIHNNKGMTPLHYTAHYGCLEVARLLLEHNAEVNAQDHNGSTPFLVASARCHSKVWQLLLDHRADVHVRDNDGRTPLHFAAHHGDLELAQILLERNVEINTRDDEGFTPLLRALKRGNLDILQLLIDHDADVHVRDYSGNTALHAAAARGHAKVVQILLERNAEANSLNDDGSTPLQLASEGSHPDVMRLLLDHGADAQAGNLGGKAASEVACGPKQHLSE